MRVTGGMLAPVGSTDKAKISLSLSSRNRWMIIYWPRPRPQREGGFLGSARTGRAGRRTPRRGPLPLRLAEPEASLPWLVDPVGKPDQRSEDCCRGPFAIAIPGDTCGKALDWQVKTGLGFDGHLGYRRIARTVHIFRAVLCAATVERIGRPNETRQAGRRAPPSLWNFAGNRCRAGLLPSQPDAGSARCGGVLDATVANCRAAARGHRGIAVRSSQNACRARTA